MTSTPLPHPRGRKLPLALLSGLLAAGPLMADLPPWPIPPDLEALHGVVIGNGGGRTLHAEIIRSPDPSVARGRGIIYVHGGGWSSGSQEYDVVRIFFLARAGYVIASIDYRLSGEAKWPAQIEDCKLGVRWFRAHARDYGIDPDHLGVYGISAGAHLAACLGVMHDPGLEGHGGYEGVSSRVQAIVDTAGPVDFVGDHFYAGNPSITADQKKKDDQMMSLLLGVPFANDPSLYREASPIYHVTADTPPFFIAHGEKDPIVSPRQAEHFADVLHQAGVPVQFVLVKNAVHGLGGIPKGPPPSPTADEWHRMILDFYARYLGQ